MALAGPRKKKRLIILLIILSRFNEDLAQTGDDNLLALVNKSNDMIPYLNGDAEIAAPELETPEADVEAIINSMYDDLVGDDSTDVSTAYLGDLTTAIAECE